MSRTSKLSVYDTQTKQFILDSVDRSVIEEKFGVSSKAISQYIYKGYKMFNRYIICRQEDMGMVEDAENNIAESNEEPSAEEDFIKRWDEMLELFKPVKKKDGAVR